MKRLVYAPKVWAFIRSSNQGGKIYDVSSDLVRGQVTQNLGDMSTAQFELRNRFYKWVRSREDSNRQIFLPMDLVTIWMQRIAGRPVQVFTGYLDEVPYYQAYPSNAIFKASCTMKKLAFNWFDPGLPTWTQWLQAQGWAVDPTTGGAIGVSDPSATVTGIGQTVSPLVATSASFADLLGRFMVDVAGWSPTDVVIGTLPPETGAQAAKLYTAIEDEQSQTLQEASDFFGQILGVQGSPALASLVTGDNVQDRVLPPGALPTVQKVGKAATDAGLPPWLLVFAGLALSHFNPAYRLEDISQPSWGYGLYALRPSVLGAVDQLTKTIDGVSADSMRDPSVATRVFAARLNKTRGGVDVAKAIGGDLGAAQRWVEAAAGYAIPARGPRDAPLADLVKAAQKVTQTQKTEAGAAKPMLTVDAKNTPLTSPAVQKNVTAAERQVIEKSYKNASPVLGAALLLVKSVSPSLVISDKVPTGDVQGTSFFVTGSEADLQRLWAFYSGKAQYAAVQYRYGNLKPSLRYGSLSAIPNTLPADAKGVLVTVDAAAFGALGQLSLAIDPSEAVDTTSLAVEGGITFKQLAAFSANAAFAAEFAFPGDVLAARFLRGEKALLNDVSCLDGVKQLAGASLRTFRSLPDGRFMAFYPDYFGASRDPYWKVYNIELTDFGIQLNDDALATHVYVIGDQLPAMGGSDELLNQLYSRGVATITQALMLDSFIAPLGMATDSAGADVPFSLLEPYSFLEHYGNRPHKEDHPLIRNAWYEFAMAWQKFMQLWAQQFATSVSFTFQPEVMAGGLIHFPDHHVQMFCDSVTHTFDYESGFQTTAVLTAPSLPKGDRRSKINFPGFALGGGVNTVGAA